MINITRPKSLFGKIPYAKEEVDIIEGSVSVIKGVVAINPKLIVTSPPFQQVISVIPEHIRINSALKHFSNAKKRFERIL